MANIFFPPNSKRVELSTKHNINKKIREDTVKNVVKYSSLNKQDAASRIEKLNREWDTERILEANASLGILITIFLGFAFSRLWFYISALIAFYLLQHAIQGWCPPVPIIRKLGVRTMSEIHNEKTAIKAMRGDFEGAAGNVNEVLDKIESK